MAPIRGPWSTTGPKPATSNSGAATFDPRAAGPFGRINCSTLRGALLESTLFGHRKGAFTGAVSAEPGLFVESDGGTLLLDEWTELPFKAQPRLLRALEEREIRAVGAAHPRPVDVRVIGATNRDPEAEVQGGRLRPDLFHRLATHLVQVPPLAERRFYVPELFVGFLAELRDTHPELGWLWAQEPRRPPGLRLHLVVQLMRSGWPGNVRELQNVAQRLAVRARQPGTPLSLPETSGSASPGAPPPPERASVDIGPAAHALGVSRKVAARLLPRGALAQLQPDSTAFAIAVRDLARRSLEERLERSAFNQTATAAVLGMARNTLARLMRLLAVPTADDLSLAAIDAAITGSGGDEVAAAQNLRVSYRALVHRRSALRRHGSDAD